MTRSLPPSLSRSSNVQSKLRNTIALHGEVDGLKSKPKQVENLKENKEENLKENKEENKRKQKEKKTICNPKQVENPKTQNHISQTD